MYAIIIEPRKCPSSDLSTQRRVLFVFVIEYLTGQQKLRLRYAI